MLLALALAAAASSAPAPVTLPEGDALRDAVAARDSELFDLVFLGCDPERLATMLTDDFEMYHDKGGVVAGDEVTLSINNGQSMQAWERALMEESADLLCEFGSEFLEAGLGLGLSALRIARHPRTWRHVVVELYDEVIPISGFTPGRYRGTGLPPCVRLRA